MSLRDMFIDIGWNINSDPLLKADMATDKFKQNVMDTNRGLITVGSTVATVGAKVKNAFTEMTTKANQFTNEIKNHRLEFLAMAAASGGVLLKSIFNAGDANETISMFKEVFKTQADEVKLWADRYAADVGRSKYATYEWLATVQDTLVPMGMVREQASEMSKDIVQLSVDLGSFKNIGAKNVIDDMTSALVGNHETVRKYGIVITEASLKQEALNQGLSKGFSDLTELEKMMLRYNIILNGTTDAQDDAMRTQGSFNNQWQNFKGLIQDSSVALGLVFLPTANRLLGTANKLLRVFQEHEGFAMFTGGILFTTFAVTGLLAAIGFLGPAIITAVGFFSKANLIAFFTNPVFLTIGAVLGLALAIDDLWTGIKGGNSVLMPIIDGFFEWLGVGWTVKGMFDSVAGTANDMWLEIKEVWNDGDSFLGDLVNGWKVNFQADFIMFANIFKIGFGLIYGLFTNNWTILSDGVDGFLGGLEMKFEGIKIIFTRPIEWVKGELLEFVDWIKEKVDIVGTIKDGIVQKLPFLEKPMNALGQMIDKFLPHSPAKYGPLSDLDKVGPRFIFTLGQGILQNASVLQNSMQKVLNPAQNYLDAFSGVGSNQQTTNINNNSSTVVNKNNTVTRSQTPVVFNIYGNPDESTVRKIKKLVREVIDQKESEEFHSIALEG